MESTNVCGQKEREERGPGSVVLELIRMGRDPLYEVTVSWEQAYVLGQCDQV